MLLTAIAAAPVAVWIYLVVARGGFWRVSKSLAHPRAYLGPVRRVVAIIPARDEAATIGATVQSLVEQEFPALLHIIIVDDGSTDGTANAAVSAAERAGAATQLTVVRGEPLITGWTGKLWAVSQGARRAEALAPDYLLLTDADICHGPKSVAGLVAIAESEGYDLVSYMAKLESATFADRALIPAFVFFFFMLYPPAWVRSSRFHTAGAAGGCILLRPDALRRMGGFAAIANEVIDDCALARRIKHARGHVWLGLSTQTRSLRSYRTCRDIGKMISRTAFNQLHHSIWLLLSTMAGLFVVYLLPPLLVLAGDRARILGVTAWVLMSVCYLPMVRFYRVSILWSITLPAIAVFYVGATLHSAIQYWLGRGGEWKGRVQDVRTH